MTRQTTVIAALFVSTLAVAPHSVHAETRVAPVPQQPAFSTGDKGAYGLALARYLDRYDSGWVDQYMKAHMTLFDARGDSVKRRISQKILEGRRGDKSIVRFLAPADIRGVAVLTHENRRRTDDSWLYLPASRRVRRISGANRTASFQGTEFTYEDLSSLIVDKYRWRHVRNGRRNGSPVYVLDARPTYRDTGYSRLRVYLHKTHWRVEAIEYFDKAGRKLKTLTNSGWRHLHKRFWRATRLSMNNHQTKKRTVINVSALFVNLAMYPKRDGSRRSNLSSRHFRRSVLERR